MNEQWIQQMQQKMAGYEYPAPELPWDEVDRVLSANKSRSARVLWLRRMAAAAVILLIAGVGYWSFLSNESEQSPSITASVEEQSLDAYEEQPEKQVDTAPATSDMFLKKTKPQHELVAISEPEEVITVSTIDPDTINTPATSEQKQPQAAEKKTKPSESPRHVIYPSDLRDRKHSVNRLTAQVYMSSTMTGGRTDYFNAQGGYASSDPFQDSVQHIHHRQPIRFGFSLRYRFNADWSVESGLTYTRLSSDINTTVGRLATVTEQQLNYIGLPLNISYEFYKSRHFGLYLTTGGTTEKCLDTSSWQFSLNGAIGAEYQLMDFLSLYAEPGLGYYFKNGSTKPTIYLDHPLNFNLSLGLRFTVK